MIIELESKWKEKIVKMGGSHYLNLDADIRKFLNYEGEDTIKLEAGLDERGQYISIYLEKNEKKVD